jgi:multidrug efflux pump
MCHDTILSRKAPKIGTGMLGGIVFSAVIGVVMVPVCYVAVIKTTQIFHKRLEANR